MTVNMLVVGEHAIQILDAAIIDDTWFSDFNVPQNTEGLRRVQLTDVVYLLSTCADLTSRFLVVQTGISGIFAIVSRPNTAFERILRVALRQFNRNISIPIQWQPYHEGSRLSVYAEPFFRRRPHRIYFDQAPSGSSNLFAFRVRFEIQG